LFYQTKVTIVESGVEALALGVKANRILLRILKYSEQPMVSVREDEFEEPALIRSIFMTISINMFLVTTRWMGPTAGITHIAAHSPITCLR
jgi:hypothetical protein